MSDIVIIGGGVIGLTCAYEIASLGATVTVVDRQQVGREASWAGAGMLPPGQCSGPSAVRNLAKQSTERWPQLSAELLSQIGLDNGFRKCGALQISLDNRETISAEVKAWAGAEVEAELLDSSGLKQFEPVISDRLAIGYRLPTMSQVRNPHHLQALKQACLSLNVKIIEGVDIREISLAENRIQSVTDGTTTIHADRFVLASGAWSEQLAGLINIELKIEPIRGQIVLMKLPQPTFTHIIEDGPRYLVPREDGHVLIGSTEERAGFVKENTEQGVQGLIDFAASVVPSLTNASIVKTWSGLRPKAKRGYPYIGQHDKIENLIIAAGHFRDGLSQSPATAQLVCDYLFDRPKPVDANSLAFNTLS